MECVTSSDLSYQKTAVQAIFGGEEKNIPKDLGGDKQWLGARNRAVFVDMERRKQM